MANIAGGGGRTVIIITCCCKDVALCSLVIINESHQHPIGVFSKNELQHQIKRVME